MTKPCTIDFEEWSASLHQQSAVPLFHRIALAFQRAIQSGEVAPGTRLPGEAQLADKLRISRPTIRRSLTVLERDGCLERVHGVGTYIR